MSLFDNELYVPVVQTQLTEAAGIDALRNGWGALFGLYPSNKALAILVAQSVLETGRFKKINNFNFGNLKMAKGKEFTMFATGENIWNKKLQKNEWHWFEPPHEQTAFRSYNTAEDGAKDYIQFLSDRNSSEAWRNEAYKKAFEFLRQGEPEKYSYALHKAGYYTANPERYTEGVVRLYNEFLEKINKTYPELPVIKEPHDTWKTWAYAQAGWEELQKKRAQEGVQDNQSKHANIEEVVIEGDLTVDNTDEDDVESESQAITNTNSKSKAGILVVIAAGLSAIYMWLTNLF